MKDCVFRRDCKKVDGDTCNPLCYPYTYMQGVDGQGGMWRTRNVPVKYDDNRTENLPQVSAYSTIQRYLGNVSSNVKNGIGLYLFSKPSHINKYGTGTGKTTSAITILNEYVIARVIEHMQGLEPIVGNPVLFVKMSDFQNIYNAQFRGDKDMQDKASDKYYSFKQRMKAVDLLVVDDIATRSGTEAFINEMYELIDHRAVEELATIFTSNVPLEELNEIYGDRIVSRIEGMTHAIPFEGKDHRKKVF